MHGRGVRTWPDGGTYDGEWNNGIYDGWGVRQRADGGRYEGLWRDGCWSRGTWHNTNGVDVQEGEWRWDEGAKCHKLHGWGVWRKKMVKGDDGRYTEAAKTTPPTAAVMVTVYEGEWNNRQRHGNGMWRSEDTGTIWCGEWNNDVMSGRGRMLIGDNSRYKDPGGSYVGERKNDQFHGEGVRLWSNGDRYQGSWVDEKEHGNGTKRWARDGSSFTGVWERGAPVKGTMEWPNGDMFTGTFTEEAAENQRGGEMRRYRGEGVLSLSPLSSVEGDRSGRESTGSLRGNTFHGADGVALHVMGSSLPQLGHRQLIKQNGEEDDELLAVHGGANETGQQRCSEALFELSTAFKVATKFRSQLKNAAPLLVSLEESDSELKQFLESYTERNQSLEVHLRDLSALKEVLEKAVEESDTRCKEILGQTLTVESSESEIQQCSRNISSLMKKLLGIKPSPRNNEEQGKPSVPAKDINKLMALKPWLLLKSMEPPPPTTSSGPFTLLLRDITADTVLSTQGGCIKFDNCVKVLDQHTALHKECNAQAALSQRLHKKIGELLEPCQGLNEAYQSKYMVMRGLEGDEQFMSHPDVWSQLSELLPHAQQAVMDVMVSKCTSSTTQRPQGEFSYEGEWRDGEMHGSGVYKWPDGTTYVGHWRNGKRHGEGVWHCTDGGWFSGTYMDNKWKSGTWHDPSGTEATYAENWVWNTQANKYQIQGRGAYRRLKKGGGDGDGDGGGGGGLWETVYDGEWAGGLMHGRGTLRTAETGEEYCGGFDHGVRSGAGTLHFRDGQGGFGAYEGQWLEGRFHGQGVYLWPSRDVYDGQWDCGREHGRGRKTWARDGSSFDGQWDRGLPRKGVMEWPNGDKFEGTFREVVGSTNQPSGVVESRGEGCLVLPGSTTRIKGFLQSNTFHGVDGTALHKMGSSLPNYIHAQNVKNLRDEHEIERRKWNKEKQALQENQRSSQIHMKEVDDQKADLIQQLSTANRKVQQLEKQLEEETSDTMPALYSNKEPVGEMKTAFTLATKIRSQIIKGAPQLISLEKATMQLRNINQCAEDRNQKLQGHVRDLNGLKATFAEGIKDYNQKTDVILGKNLTEDSSRDDIKACSNHLSILTTKLYDIQVQRSALTVPTIDGCNLLERQPWSQQLQNPQEPPPSAIAALSSPSPFAVLEELSDTLHELQNCKFDECTKVMSSHTELIKESTSQATKARDFEASIRQLHSECQRLNAEYNRKYTLLKGLQGDEQFMSHLDVLPRLREMVPKAQDSLIIMLCSRMPTPAPSPSPPRATTGAGSTSSTVKSAS
ncbi:phosphatidylinositol 4-phosphate 5-kinase 8 [Pelomyxa schiedti]|nr:phosphatidylinositol 4-phosphate 5-kinase 8 [Pelomyxa schiedti]